jgi:transcriptional regulator with XRE-family HTH domain
VAKKRNALGARIKELREAQDMTGQDLALSVGVSASHLSRIERDLTSPSFTVAARLADTLGVTPGELAAFEREHADENERLIAALIALAIDDEIACEIQRSLSVRARRALLAALER